MNIERIQDYIDIHVTGPADNGMSQGGAAAAEVAFWAGTCSPKMKFAGRP